MHLLHRQIIKYSYRYTKAIRLIICKFGIPVKLQTIINLKITPITNG